MSSAVAELYGFAYGENVDGTYGRSLGYSLVAPAALEPWCTEVEALARRLQEAPYPDHWLPSDLFCSALLSDGRRLVGLARYGLADHTPDQRRGGLELIGVVAPGSLGVVSALAIYQWLRQRRAQTEDLRVLGSQHALADVLSTVEPTSPPADPIPVLPIRLWQEGALLFAATAPSDPDHGLGLLDQGAAGTWQWLPLVGTDFPFQSYSQRGPLIAWTPHLAGVALKLDHPRQDSPGQSSRWRLAVTAFLLLLLLLLGGNLWATLALFRNMHANSAQSSGPGVSAPPSGSPGGSPEQGSQDRFIQALHRLLVRHAGVSEWTPDQIDAQYRQLVETDPDLRVTTSQGRETVVEVHLLSRRSADQVEALIRKTLANKGYDPDLVDLACRQVRTELTVHPAGSP